VVELEPLDSLPESNWNLKIGFFYFCSAKVSLRTDYFEVVIGTKFLAAIMKEAPLLQISFRPTFGSLPKVQLEDGSYDLAIAGFYKNLPEGFIPITESSCSTLEGTVYYRMKKVTVTRFAEKQLTKLPSYIREALRYWAETVERKGQRSIRLNKAYRAIYVESDGGIEICIIEVNKHEY
jgi:hypothetical protein